MEENKSRGTPDQKIAHKAKVWRRCDKALIGDKVDQRARTAEFLARQDLRKTIDDAGEP